MQLKPIINLLKKELPHLQGIYLFGSYASGDQVSKSDIDLAVLCSQRLTPALKQSIQLRLEHQLAKNVDLIELRYVNTLFQEEIIHTAKRIATIDKAACETYEDYIYCSAMDFRAFRKPHVLEIIARGSVYG